MFGSLSSFESSLFDDFRRVTQEMDQLFGAMPWPNGIRAVAKGTYPPINIGSTGNQIDVYLFAAGMDPNSLDISIQQNLLTIKGQRRIPAAERATYYRKERVDGAFHRVVTLPEDIDPDQVEARYQDGVLHVLIQRRESVKPRQIQVN
ncbi:MAG: Hsp20/alpha crystallin family protein [Methylococcaceae bacterium]|nr:Hsp20/alpha crystallin family protein [Methylococcaceae bacterium]